MGSENEQYCIFSGGNRTEGIDLQLNLFQIRTIKKDIQIRVLDNMRIKFVQFTKIFVSKEINCLHIGQQ